MVSWLKGKVPKERNHYTILLRLVRVNISGVFAGEYEWPREVMKEVQGSKLKVESKVFGEEASERQPKSKLTVDS